MGLGLYFSEGEGPQFERPIRSAADIDRIKMPDPEEELRYVMDAVRLIKRELDGKIPLIGFCGSPWTLATYMVEGRSSKEFAKVKGMMFNEPGHTRRLLAILADALVQYLKAQIKAGADAVMIFDTWGGLLTTAAYQEFSLNYMTQIVGNLKNQNAQEKVPIVLFTKGGNYHDIISLGWNSLKDED